MISVYKRILCMLVLSQFCLHIEALFNRSLFFRTSSFWDEPRFEKPYLATYETQLLGGSNHNGTNGCHKKTNILSIYGPENIRSLIKASPDLPLVLPDNPHDICFQGVADVFETDFNLYQNFSRGFFVHFHLPIIVLQTYPSGYLQDDCCCRKASKDYKTAWQRSLQPLNTFLSNFDIAACMHREAGLSDSTLFIGWTKSFENTCYLDFIDFTAKTGVLIPSGKKKNVHQLFDVPLGYNGHWAIPLLADASIGIFDWLTVGLHADSLFFIDKKQCVRMKAPHQKETGFIRLGLSQAIVDHGTVWRVGTYVKADHFFNGLSLLLGFSYEQQNRTRLLPCDTKLFNPDFVNDDEQLKKWDRSIAHLLAEYDFTCEGSFAGPRIGFFFDKQMTGKRVYNISTLGGYLGLDISWCY